MTKTRAKLEVELAEILESNRKLAKENEEIKAKAEAMKVEAKRQMQERAKEHKNEIKVGLDAEPHHWVRVFNKGLDDGVDFAFTYEGIIIRLISGEPVYLAESVIKHLKGCGYPKPKLKQGEAGQTIKVEGRYYCFNIVECEAPEKAAVAV